MPSTGPEQIGNLLNRQKAPQQPAPAHAWQELALQVCSELKAPAAKKGAIFKICKQFPRPLVEKALNESKELATGEQWRYFFKVLGNIRRG